MSVAENPSVGHSEDAVAASKVKPLDIAAVRADFPALDERVNDHPLVYLDSAASAQKPRQVLDAERDCYEHFYANVHRGVHTLSVKATAAFEEARAKIARMLGTWRRCTGRTCGSVVSTSIRTSPCRCRHRLAYREPYAQTTTYHCAAIGTSDPEGPHDGSPAQAIARRTL